MIDIKCYPNNRDEFVGAETLMKWLHGRTSGVFAADSSAAVSAAQGKMAVTVSDGYGWITDADKNGIVWWIETYKTTGNNLEVPVDPADGILSRVDRVIVEWNTANYSEYPTVKVLKGSLSTNPMPPTISNTSAKRQIALGRVLIPAGTTSITPDLITDERLDPSVCGIVTEQVEVDTSMINAQVSYTLEKVQADTRAVLDDTERQSASVLESINNELQQIQSGSGVELAKLQFTDVEVPVSAFVDDTTYQDYPYRASIALENVIQNMIPEVVLGVEDATSGNFGPVAECYNGGVYIYAASPPDVAMTIPTILCWRGNA